MSKLKTVGPNPGRYDGQHYNYFNGVDEHQPFFTENGNPSAHPALPILTDCEVMGSKYGHNVNPVWVPGTAIALDEEGFFVPANGGYANVVTYTAFDVANDVCLKDLTLVAAGDTKTFKANKPAGISFDIQLQSPLCKEDMALVSEQNHAQVFRKGLVIMPIIFKTENSKYDFKAGDFVVPDSPSADDKLNNPVAKVGGYRVFREGVDDTVVDNSTIKRTANLRVLGKEADSHGQIIGKVLNVADHTTVNRDKTLFNESYGSTRMVSKETAGYVPAYYLIWKSGLVKNPYSATASDYKVASGDYKLKLVYISLSIR